MINRLIDMEVLIPKNKQIINNIKTNSDYSIQEYAIAFIYGMSENQKDRFKKMLENNIECGMSVAKSYGVDYSDFIEEVKKQLKVEV